MTCTSLERSSSNSICTLPSIDPNIACHSVVVNAIRIRIFGANNDTILHSGTPKDILCEIVKITSADAVATAYGFMLLVLGDDSWCSQWSSRVVLADTQGHILRSRFQRNMMLCLGSGLGCACPLREGLKCIWIAKDLKNFLVIFLHDS